MKSYIYIMLFGIVANSQFLLLSLVAAPQKTPPNIVLIMVDDLGGRDLAVYGNKFNESPNIDKLATQGMVFDQAYAAPVCSATRASIQSGQTPARVGIFDFIPGHWRPYEKVTVPHHKIQHLPKDIFTLGDAMKSAGYKTGYFGKWHLNDRKSKGKQARHTPDERGYDKSYMYNGGGFYRPVFQPAYRLDKPKRLSQILTDMGVDFIKENKDQPFFLFVSHYDVHVQLDADKDLINKYLNKKRDPNYPGNAVYAAMIEHTDDSVGQLMKAIDDQGLTDNTIFIFYSDNGGVDNRYDDIPLLGGRSANVYPEGHPLRYVATSNAPLRSGKGTLYEGGIRVPLIVRWPGKVNPGTRSEAVFSSSDFYPSFLEITNTQAPKNQVLDGVSMVPALTKNSFDPERELFTHYPVYHHDVPMSALRKGDWKIIENLVSKEFYLYNIKYDVNEMVDHKVSLPAKFSGMKAALAKWQKETKAQMPVPNPKFDPSKRYQWGANPYK
ncbi:sulfatase [Lentisphaera marina]|uniref:sulfatase n=1 Tax=Lentisphaera marina TaxID=1111041 RepID=UPI002366E49F|nr:sulfatase [Lentisphaera marina]MDD7985053.1 sulfatase [Lentisphaera marina]